MRTLLDTNCILRYLLNDIPEQADTVASAIGEGAITSPEFIAECVYVLSGSVYGFSRKETAEALLLLLDEVDCDHYPATQRALEIFQEKQFDFADCVLAARHEVEGIPVMTFDKKLSRFIASSGNPSDL